MKTRWKGHGRDRSRRQNKGLLWPNALSLSRRVIYHSRSSSPSKFSSSSKFSSPSSSKFSSSSRSSSPLKYSPSKSSRGGQCRWVGGIWSEFIVGTISSLGLVLPWLRWEKNEYVEIGEWQDDPLLLQMQPQIPESSTPLADCANDHDATVEVIRWSAPQHAFMGVSYSRSDKLSLPLVEENGTVFQSHQSMKWMSSVAIKSMGYLLG